MARRSRHEIPDALHAAKRRVVDGILMQPRRTRRRLAHTISTHPHDNVVGVGVGTKIDKRTRKHRPCIRFYVAHKLHPSAIAPEHLLPKVIDGLATDVIETGRFRAQVPAARKRRRPAQPGCSLGFGLPAPDDGFRMAGTFGALVERDQTRFILSNNHVLANENRLPIGSSIYQPGLLDSGNRDADVIARLTQFVPLDPANANRVDCAIAEVADAGSVRARVLAKVGRLSSGSPLDATDRMRVEKVGRGTGYTTGIVFDVSADIALEFEIGELKFADQILIQGDSGAFSADGDSGALVVAMETAQAIGLLIGGSPSFSIANHITDVLSELNVTLIA